MWRGKVLHLVVHLPEIVPYMGFRTVRHCTQSLGCRIEPWPPWGLPWPWSSWRPSKPPRCSNRLPAPWRIGVGGGWGWGLCAPRVGALAMTAICLGSGFRQAPVGQDCASNRTGVLDLPNPGWAQVLPGDPVESVQLISAKAAALVLGISVHTLKRWRRCGEGPDWCRVGRRAIRYRSDVLDKWLRSISNPDLVPHQKSSVIPTWPGTSRVSSLCPRRSF